MGIATSCIAALLNLYGFILYIRHALKGDSKPNIISWSIFVIANSLNAFTYNFMSNDYVKTFALFAAMFSSSAIFVYSIYTKRWRKVDIKDYIALGFALGAIIVWWYFHSPTIANVLFVQPIFMIGFIPTYRSVWKNPQNEFALPWKIWNLSHGFNIATVLLRWQNQPQDLVYPVILFIMNFSVTVLCKRSLNTSSKAAL